VPRSCGWCTSPHRTDWEGRVQGGEPVSVVSADSPYSVSAANRHIRLHMRPALVAELGRTQPDLDLSSFVNKLLSLVSAAERVRDYAEATANPRLILEAIRRESDLLSLLMRRLGIDSDEAAELHREARSLSKEVGTMVRSGRHDDFAEELADRLELRGETNLSGSVRALAATERTETSGNSSAT
jgi:hypothetical protein